MDTREVGRMMDWNGGGVGWVLMALIMGLFWGAVIWGIVYIVRQGREPSHQDRSLDRSAMDVLEERFARGEIDRDEFQERRDTLVGGGAGGRGASARKNG
jgi:putative membrane protein